MPAREEAALALASPARRSALADRPRPAARRRPHLLRHRQHPRPVAGKRGSRSQDHRGADRGHGGEARRAHGAEPGQPTPRAGSCWRAPTRPWAATKKPRAPSARPAGWSTKDAHLLAEYAEALALATGGSLRGRPSELLARALKLDPNFPDALVLAGTAAYEREDYAAAAAYWERLLKQLPADSEDAKSLAESIDKAKVAARKQKKKR
jgi:hypothetical protein